MDSTDILYGRFQSKASIKYSLLKDNLSRDENFILRTLNLYTYDRSYSALWNINKINTYYFEQFQVFLDENYLEKILQRLLKNELIRTIAEIDGTSLWSITYQGSKTISEKF